jgi:hypothetical protein
LGVYISSRIALDPHPSCNEFNEIKLKTAKELSIVLMILLVFLVTGFHFDKYIIFVSFISYCCSFLPRPHLRHHPIHRHPPRRMCGSYEIKLKTAKEWY